MWTLSSHVNSITVDVGYKHTGYKNISDIRTLYWKTVAIYPIPWAQSFTRMRLKLGGRGASASSNPYGGLGGLSP